MAGTPVSGRSASIGVDLEVLEQVLEAAFGAEAGAFHQDLDLLDVELMALTPVVSLAMGPRVAVPGWRWISWRRWSGPRRSRGSSRSCQPRK